MIPIYLFVLIPIFFATFAFVGIPYKLFKKAAFLVQSILFAMAFVVFWQIKHEGNIIQHIGQWPSFVGITLRADLLAASMLMLTCFLFFIVMFYDYAYHLMDKRYLFLFLVLQGLLSGIFLSNDLFNIYVLIEVSAVVVAMLILYNKNSRSMYDGLVYLLLNLVAATFFLFGIAFLYRILGVMDFYGIEQRASLVENRMALLIPYSLIMTGGCLKAALLPLFSWLPKAHGTPGAPTIVSALLSGLFVKSGVYLFIRVNDAFCGVIDTGEFFLVVGFLTGVVGFLLALCQSDIKLILAYSTISQIGLIMLAINCGNPQGYWGGIYHIINHAIFKSVLFLTAGLIVGEYKTRNLYGIKDVFRKMPVVGIASLLAILGIIGTPLMNGSISKYYIAGGVYGSVMEYGLMLLNVGTIIIFIRYGTMLLPDKNVKNVDKVTIEPHRKLVIIFMSALVFLGGIFGRRIIEFLFNQSYEMDLALYGQKSLIFLASLVVAFIIYDRFVSKTGCLLRLGAHDVSFNNACLSIVVFFATLLLFLTVKYTFWA